MKRTLKSLKAEATEHGITIYNHGEMVNMYAASQSSPIAWMHKTSENGWTGFTSEPNTTGRKHGTKAEVMDWCLDWAINGF